MKILVFMFEGPISNIKKIQFFFGGGINNIDSYVKRTFLAPLHGKPPDNFFIFFYFFESIYIYI